ncbi:hypothetical protein IFM89_015481 [Coptis chinensis]|uniref:Uncharacterized protein n=1 Tax=Coptis chinensis TaxID=261450 RepID=A0A835GXM1_9MAGN|nr:hypothetical protein IFM89_015481 [Coptis chinensis]
MVSHPLAVLILPTGHMKMIIYKLVFITRPGKDDAWTEIEYSCKDLKLYNGVIYALGCYGKVCVLKGLDGSSLPTIPSHGTVLADGSSNSIDSLTKPSYNHIKLSAHSVIEHSFLRGVPAYAPSTVLWQSNLILGTLSALVMLRYFFIVFLHMTPSNFPSNPDKAVIQLGAYWLDPVGFERRTEMRKMYVPRFMYLIIIFSCFLLFHNHVQAQEPILEICSNTANYTSNSQFQTNLNILLPSLLSDGTRDGFFNTSIGTSPDIVYGLVQCRGDISMEDCRSCLNNSAVEIIRRCPNRKDAALRYDHCILRYSNTRFFSQVDSTRRGLLNRANVSDADANRYNRQLGSLLNSLSTTAASVVTKFGAASTDYADFKKIYGLVMCTRDLPATQCFSCLQSMIGWIPSCCTNREGAQIFSTTCYIRYEIYPFVQISSQSPSPPPPVQGKSVNVVAIVVPVIVAVILAAICVYFIIKRTRKNRRKRKSELIYENDIRSEDSLQFDLNMIRTATNDFSDANKLGEGGFGAVYKGELLDGQEIAVKRLSKNSGQGSLEFKNEVVLLHKLQHRNLVRLLGFCLAGEEKVLIYEYVPNRSLDKYIFGLSH